LIRFQKFDDEPAIAVAEDQCSPAAHESVEMDRTAPL
jgi:hypothetical protein